MLHPVRLAMWSGPRNISTAMLRSFGNRSDSFVCDEPLYAHYLKVTGVPHPGREEVIAHYENDWRKVVEWLTGPIPEGKTLFYQKHMTHHMIPEVGRDWLGRVTHAFLIREPAEMLTSLRHTFPTAALADTGLVQQRELFDQVADLRGEAPPVVDAQDILEAPEPMLRKLCAAVGISFEPAMLHWAPGSRDTDGIWARHWYGALEASTGFKQPGPRRTTVAPPLQPLLDECLPLYAHLFSHRLRP